MHQTLQLLCNDQRLTLEEATCAVGAAVYDWDMRRSRMLFGDPTMQVDKV
jgi:hypothetical protein